MVSCAILSFLIKEAKRKAEIRLFLGGVQVAAGSSVPCSGGLWTLRPIVSVPAGGWEAGDAGGWFS